jgi:hypothetical protein
VTASDPMPRASLMTWLDLIRARPGMYLGASPPHYGAMLDRLESWIVGYSEAIRTHEINDAGIELYWSFWPFLEKRLGRSMAEGTIPTIRILCVNDEEAWNMYWSLLAEFRARPAAG